ncbi:MAG: gliding motility-associated C-terminal domain-containing protein, partial [Bacteroidales bacterium]|nr:gliding motility-associated C-terminal domain-containing protein [Bacteroidales bacterium]
PIVVTRTYTVTDACGNANTYDQTINVDDSTFPTLVCPGNIIQCADNGLGAFVSGISLLSYSDNCSLPGNLVVLYNISGATIASGTGDASDSFFNTGLSTVQYVVIDEATNAATCNFDVTINPLPITSDIAGNNILPCYASNETYTVNHVPDSKYLWTVPSDATILTDTSGLGVNSIQVNFGSVSNDITVTELNAYGCMGVTKSLEIHLLGCELIANFETDKTTACQQDTIVVWSTSSGVSGSSSYSWDFGINAIPATAAGPGPHEIYYTSDGLKTITLTVAEGVTDTISKDVTILALPGIVLSGDNRCGSGDVIYEAIPDNGNVVEFSYDAGSTIEESINFPPYHHTANLNENETLEVWARAVNSVYGCYGNWSESITLTAYPLPVTGEIIPESTSVTPPENHLDVACHNESKTYSVNATPGSTYTWNVPDLSIQIEDAESIEVIWETDEGSHSITVRETSDEGCEGSLRSEQVYVSAPEVDLGSDQEICEGESYTFIVPDGFASYEWHDNSTGREYTGSANEMIWVGVTSDYGCTDHDTAELIVHPLPILDLGDDISVCGEEGYEIYPGEYNSYQWTIGSNTYTSSSVIVYSGTGTVTLTVTNSYNCEAEDEIEILPCDPDLYFGEISNVFTPNGDGVHETWVINNIELYPDATIEVFDRTGRLVFHKDGGYGNDWDGTFKGKPLPMDTYYYIIDFKSTDLAPRKGTVTIVRD